MSYLAALLQNNLVVGDVSGNSERILAAWNEARLAGAALCLAPELALSGYPPRDFLLRGHFVRRCLQAAREIAARTAEGPPLVLGCPDFGPADQGNDLFNCALFLRGGRVEAVYAKNLLPTYDIFDEARYFEPGGEPCLVEVEGRKVGLTVCEDLWNDTGFWDKRRYRSNPLESLQALGADVVANISASPFSLGKQQVREAMLQAAARAHSMHMLYANLTGGNDELIFDGRSMAVAPDGTLLARGAGFEEDMVLVDLDEKPGGVVAPDDFTPESEAWRALVLGTRDYARKCGFTKALLGLSGGVDSSLVAAVAAAALGPENVLGVLMPSPFSSRSSIDDSLALAANLSLETMTLPIQDLMECFGKTLSEPFRGLQPDVTEENIQSRIRGNLLMALSNKYRSLLLTTGNKSELAVGYCTIYGDMSGGLAVISDLPKTLVYSLCRWINGQQGEIIPPNVLDKPPSAELRPGQTDQESLPPYEVLDPLLDGIIREHLSIDELVERGFEARTARKVACLVKTAEFKRRQAAPGLKITDRAFGTGWRMPLACKDPGAAC